MIITYLDLETEWLSYEVGGWGPFWEGGGGSIPCAVTVTEDSEVGEFTVGLHDTGTIDGLVDVLEGSDQVITFNGTGFDIPIIVHHYGENLNMRRHIDILAMVKEANGGLQHRKWGLDSICRQTLGVGKTGSSKNAPLLARSGEWAKLFQYCLNDVLITRKLWIHILKYGTLTGGDGQELDLSWNMEDPND